MPVVFSMADFSMIFYNRSLSGAGCSPIKFAESLACGVPVIINRGIGDCDKIVKENGVGIVLENFSEADFEKAIDEMGLMLLERENTRRRCREVAGRLFPLKKGVDDYARVYERLAK